uniref:Integrase catalytic domain-containing protein n=1 Tax=Fagus sylvatica TaxID=28930 RepID=A0A2N9I5H9_FAGSY
MWTVPLCRHLHLIPQPLRHQTPNTWRGKPLISASSAFLLSSLTEEAMAEAVGLSTSREALVPSLSYARAFKALCDQLHAIGRPVDDTDKTHWFLRGLGSDFSSFSTAQLALTPLPCFADLVSKAESFELFQRSLEPSATTAAAFTATSRGRAYQPWSFFFKPRQPAGSFQQPRQPLFQPWAIQLWTGTSAHLAAKFAARRAIMLIGATNDTGASAHMTPAQATLDQSTTYTEFTCNRFQDHLSTSGIHHQLSCPHTPAQNGRAERKHRHVTETGLALLFHSHTSPRFWVDAFSTAAYIINRLPTSLLGDMPPSSPAPHSPHIPQSGSNPCDICTDPVDESLQLPTPAPVAATPMPSHPMLTRAKAGIFKTRHPANLALLGSSGLLSALLASTEPKGFKSAAKNPAWLAAMDEEIQALQTNRTWILVPRPANTNIVGSKWVFRTKYLPDGSIERLKARLVAKGYTQVPGLDYTDTFSPVIKATTVRVVLSLAVTNKWPLRQLDVKNAFLNGSLTEHVYMEQPPGYIDPRFPHHVCHLKKALYGLKQAPRAWFQRFSSFLLTLGFSCSRADTSLFVFHQQSGIIYLLLYVDDIIITGNNSSLLDSFTHKLHSEFATKDLGSLSYFLGLEASPTPDGLFLSQLKYARDILTRAQLLDSKPVHTPMYLTITRPDIAHAVNSVSQFLHAPTADHFLAVKRILRYVKGTLHFGLTFRPSAAPGTLVAYSDADWAGCPDTRRSTSGYSIYLGDNLVSWSAKKQPTVSCSSCEFEYRALAMTAAELLWLTHLLHDLKVPLPQQPLLLCDNKSAIFFKFQSRFPQAGQAC